MNVKSKGSITGFSKRSLIHAYGSVLPKEISCDVAKALGFSTQEELVEAFFIDSVVGTFKDRLNVARFSETLANGEYIPACLCYRSVDSIDEPIYGGEFLARRFHPSQGLSMPGDWYKAADDSGGVVDIDVMGMLYGAKVAALLPGFSSSSNVSRQLLRDETFISRVDEVLDSTGVDPANVHLELLENIPQLNDADLFVIRSLVSRGVQMCIDDCGIANAEKLLNTLRDNGIPVHTLKIDASITASILNSTKLVCQWMRKALENEVREIVFEGGPKSQRLTPDIIRGLRRERDGLGLDIPCFVEGPIYQDM